MKCRYLHVDGQSVYPKQEKNPKGEIHTSMDIWSVDRRRGALVLRTFDNLGFVTTYVEDAGAGTETSGKVKLVQGIKTPLKDRHLLVVEDIVDTGLTLHFLLYYLQRRKPASVKLCALLDKPSRRVVDVPIDYLGFTVPNKFIVGYGCDYAEKYRNLRDVAVLAPKMYS